MSCDCVFVPLHDVFHAARRHADLLSDGLIGSAVDELTRHDLPVALFVDPFPDVGRDDRVVHRITTLLPVGRLRLKLPGHDIEHRTLAVGHAGGGGVDDHTQAAEDCQHGVDQLHDAVLRDGRGDLKEGENVKDKGHQQRQRSGQPGAVLQAYSPVDLHDGISFRIIVCRCTDLFNDVPILAEHIRLRCQPPNAELISCRLHHDRRKNKVSMQITHTGEICIRMKVDSVSEEEEHILPIPSVICHLLALLHGFNCLSKVHGAFSFQIEHLITKNFIFISKIAVFDY
nr:MAG TPA_asm: hypothetical protein [Caudoviricetes sp.]